MGKAQEIVFENSVNKKKGGDISVPFLPNGYEKNVNKYIAEGSVSKFRNLKFERIAQMKQTELKKYCRTILKRFGYKPESKAGFLYAEGEIPVLLIAHMDTVHKEIPRQIVYKDNFVTSPQGIGGDDRCGIYLILELVKDLKCHVLFTEDEEIGGIGACKFAKSDIAKRLNGNIKYCIELDRKGTEDAVFYDCDNKEFRDFIEKFGYFKEEWGSYSDICEIAPALDCSAVNLSSGYYNAHTKSEYVDLKSFKKILKEVRKIIKADCERFEWVELKKYWNGRYGGFFSESDYWDYISYNDSFFRGYDGSYDERMTEYAVFWEDYQMSATYFATSKYEALGMFMMDYPDVCYREIDYIDEFKGGF